jgi:UDP-glucose 4-epimerase
MPKKVLVTGGSGFIGSHLVPLLIGAGHDVTVLDVRAPSAWDCSRITSKMLKGVDVVYHLAWKGVPNDGDDVAEADKNVTTTRAVAEACLDGGVTRLVFLSSGGAVYGEPLAIPTREDHPLSPISMYGLAKVMAEQCVQYYGQMHGLRYVILRPSCPYGERQATDRQQGAASVFMHRMMCGEPLFIRGSAVTSVRDFFYVGDLAAACLRAADLSVPSGIYNIGSGTPISVFQLLGTIADVTGLEYKIASVPRRKCDPSIVLLDTTKAQINLGWQPTVSLREGIERTWRWMKDARPE